ncbi:hypothetical protein MAF45_08430 [Mesosutterella sp. OilRF-GAM-744-9]|uniref:Uncharacterized protein n=1 Tax=Mesosutterella porci TaxID=2915351 RepID=A0ABS9MS74_9BURK|nr:hypothetical protein [Mesosutterella sp. oilRF-744-WT-GAM-9]MCG5031465.1 hypothetical protein [Mesosutterella sp. oilRF-744-WT-GAM-9]MCI6530290.1 hypothetical protein [Mesosutterella sp.]
MSRASPSPEFHENDIWNPWAALLLSVIFTPVFGTLLHETDLRHIGDRDGALTAHLWSRGSLALLTFAAVVQPLAAVRPGWELLLLAVDLGLLACWTACCGLRHALEISRTIRDVPKFRRMPMSRAITLGLLWLGAWTALFYIAKTFWEIAGLLPAS